jgi:hypothetical protein
LETSLRPLSLSEILDRTAQLYRTNFVLFAGIFAVFCGVGLVMNLLLIGLEELLKAMHTEALAWITVAAAGLELLILFLLIGPVVAAISRAVAWVHLGEPATIRGAYAGILPRFGSYLWLMTVTAFVIYTPFVLLYAGLIGTFAFYGKGFGAHFGAHAAAADPHSMAAIGIASVAFILLIFPVLAYTILMTLRYSLALPACVLENLPALKAIRRSIELSKGARGRIFVLLLLIGAIKIGLVLVTQIFVLVSAVQNHGQLGPGMSAISQIISFFTGTFLGPIGAAGITLFYYDQRVRKEGYDIEWMMQAAGLTAPTSAVPEPQQLSAPREPGNANE